MHVGVVAHPEAVNGGYEHGSSGEHDGGVVRKVFVVECLQIVYDTLHEAALALREHEIVRHAYGDSLCEYDGILEKGIDTATTANIEVDVSPAVVVENEISDAVCALYVVRVAFD